MWLVEAVVLSDIDHLWRICAHAPLTFIRAQVSIWLQKKLVHFFLIRARCLKYLNMPSSYFVTLDARFKRLFSVLHTEQMSENKIPVGKRDLYAISIGSSKVGQ